MDTAFFRDRESDTFASEMEPADAARLDRSLGEHLERHGKARAG